MDSSSDLGVSLAASLITHPPERVWSQDVKGKRWNSRSNAASSSSFSFVSSSRDVPRLTFADRSLQLPHRHARDDQ